MVRWSDSNMLMRPDWEMLPEELQLALTNVMIAVRTHTDWEHVQITFDDVQILSKPTVDAIVPRLEEKQ